MLHYIYTCATHLNESLVMSNELNSTYDCPSNLFTLIEASYIEMLHVQVLELQHTSWCCILIIYTPSYTLKIILMDYILAMVYS